MAAQLPLDKTKKFFKEDITGQLGKIEKLDEPNDMPGGKVFVAHCERGVVDMSLVLNGKDEIAGLLFKPHVASNAAPEKHQTELSLPFKGRWLVAWGGDTKQLNQHHDTPNQRFAFDLLGVDENGNTRRNQSNTNEDYFAFDREVIAPADGRVVEAIDGVHDNEPGSMNPYSALGNCVVIRHRDDEVSVCAHLRRGSVAVKLDEQVQHGQLIGRCGNSGNSSEPHLHFHLQNSPVIEGGVGIKCTFERVVVTQNGKTETRRNYSPIKGDMVSPADAVGSPVEPLARHG